MVARIITVCNQKGGSGKTTVSMCLAGALASQGKKVLVVDADAQGTATRWAASAEENTTFPAAVIGLSAANAKVHREIKKFVNDYQYIIIDCPPAADSPVPQSALLVSDLAIVPVIPSPLDLWAAVGIREVINQVKTINENLEARLIVNQCQANTSLAKESLEILSEFGIEVCHTKIGQRQVYRQIAIFGQTVNQLGKKAGIALDEINSLTKELLEIIHSERTKAEVA
ncbi:MAG: ParA family partition ATPase [Blastocatellia bacterium]